MFQRGKEVKENFETLTFAIIYLPWVGIYPSGSSHANNPGLLLGRLSNNPGLILGRLSNNPDLILGRLSNNPGLILGRLSNNPEGLILSRDSLYTLTRIPLVS
jgi:hypothetical protein